LSQPGYKGLGKVRKARKVRASLKAYQTLSQPGYKGLRKVRKALERLDLPPKLV
jgi:hypothetical protein